MKDVRAATRAILIADPAVAAAVSTGEASGVYRIYPAILPQGVSAPSVVQNLVTEDMGYDMQGDISLMVARTQLDAWATTPDAAVSLAGKVFEAMSGYAGLVVYGSNSPQDSMIVQAIFHDQGRDDYDSTMKMHVRRRDYLIWHVVR
jgi:hypothetical protein